MSAASIEAATMKTPAAGSPRLSTRNLAVDAYRGFVMMLMLAEVLEFPTVSHALPGSFLLRVLAYNQTHVPWAGASLHDLIQPSFTFLVGMALVYSVRSRQRKGQSFRQMWGHVVLRSVLLIALGVGLRWSGGITFLDTLSQIGLGYMLAFFIVLCRPRTQWTAFALILFLYWMAWALYPIPAQPVVLPRWHEVPFTGFAAHWNKGSNLGLAFDRWFLNSLPHATAFEFSDGGYVTLNFIPTLGTMILGVIAGRWSSATSSRVPLRKFLVAGALLAVSALLLHVTGVCPIVKRIWTPTWTLFSGGVCFLFLALFSWIDSRAGRKIFFPLIVIGMNSLVAYLLVPLWGHFVNAPLERHGGLALFSAFGAFQPLAYGAIVLLIFWAVLYLLYRKQLFLKF